MAPASRGEASLLRQVLADPTRCGWRPEPDVVDNAVLEALG
jgi:hypothetical protein